MGLDASDSDTVIVDGVVLNDGININTWPNVYSYRMPTKGTTFFSGTGRVKDTYILTANQGPFVPWHIIENNASSSIVRLGSIADKSVDQSAVSNWAELKADSTAGRLLVSATDGKDPTSGLYTKFYTLGGRSFTVYKYDPATDTIAEVFDSGSDFETITAEKVPLSFNAKPCNNGEEKCGSPRMSAIGKATDSQSPYSGPAPSAVATVTIGATSYALISLYTSGGVFAYNITSPTMPSFYNYFSFREGDAMPDGKSWGTPDYTFSNFNAYYPDQDRNKAEPQSIYSIRNGAKAMDILGADLSPSGYPIVALMSSRSASTQLYQLLPENCVPGKTKLKNAKITASHGQVIDANPSFVLPNLGSQSTAVGKVEMKKTSELTVFYKLYSEPMSSLNWPQYRACTLSQGVEQSQQCKFLAFVSQASTGSQVYEGQLTSNITGVPATVRVAFRTRVSCATVRQQARHSSCRSISQTQTNPALRSLRYHIRRL